MHKSEIKNKVMKVAVGLSGGVDSSVAALLLKNEGYIVTGVHLKCWDKKADGCVADEDRSYAAQTAGVLNIEFVYLDFVSQYKEKVISYFFDEYKAGRTPNPDILCNKEIKFGMFYDWALKNGFDYVATGHYARVDPDHEKERFNLLTGTDVSKDQSYFLYLLDQEHLKNILFPLGNLLKKEIRNIAKKSGLPAAERSDSTGICFVGEINIKEFLKTQIKEKFGEVVDIKGNVIGEHDGVWFFTIGQRHGFRLKKYFGEPMYVVSKNTEENLLTVGNYQDATRSEFCIDTVHWISVDPLEKKEKIMCKVRVRHLGKLYDCEICKDLQESSIDFKHTNIDNPSYRILLKEPVFGIASGQSAVLYDGDIVLGGGIIR